MNGTPCRTACWYSGNPEPKKATKSPAHKQRAAVNDRSMSHSSRNLCSLPFSRINAVLCSTVCPRVTSRTENSQVVQENTGVLVRAAGSFDCPGNRLVHTECVLSNVCAALAKMRPADTSNTMYNVTRTLHT